jgi:hypothetical protein
MNSLSNLTAQPRKLTVAGQSYDLHPLTLDDLGQLQAWIDGQFPDPFEVIRDAIARNNYTVAQQQYLFGQAMEMATRPRRLIGTPEADRLLQSLDGTKKLLTLSIRKGRPEFTDGEAEDLYKAMDLVSLQAAFVATEATLVMGDPKAAKKPRRSTGSSASPRRR